MPILKAPRRDIMKISLSQYAEKVKVLEVDDYDTIREALAEGRPDLLPADPDERHLYERWVTVEVCGIPLSCFVPDIAGWRDDPKGPGYFEIGKTQYVIFEMGVCNVSLGECFEPLRRIAWFDSSYEKKWTISPDHYLICGRIERLVSRPPREARDLKAILRVKSPLHGAFRILVSPSDPLPPCKIGDELVIDGRLDVWNIGLA